MLNISPKPADGSSKKDADMTGGDSKSINPSYLNCAMSTLPKLVAIFEDIISALATKNDPKKCGIGFQSIADVDMVDSAKNVSNFQQRAKDNTAVNAKTSLQIAVLNKIIIPI